MRKKIENNLEAVEQLAAQGLTQQEIAQNSGVSESWLYKRKRQSTVFTEAIKKGKAKGVATVANKLFELCEAGNITAIIFYLKCRAG